MPTWIAISYGALDIQHEQRRTGTSELAVLPVFPSEPIALVGEGASLWRRLVADGPIDDRELSVSDRAILAEMAIVGLASVDVKHAARCFAIAAPWLSSPMHELVYALVASVAREHEISAVFIKGPVLHAQGLRARRHSGDVDVWVSPDRLDDLLETIASWGWTRQPDIWDGTQVNHSQTLVPTNGWGCEIDLHRRMPGLGLPDTVAFAAVCDGAEIACFGGVPASVPRREVSAVLAAVHSLRPEIGIGRRAGAEIGAAAVVRAGGDPSFDALVKLDAVQALAPVLPEVFPDRELQVDDFGAPRGWEWRGQPTRAQAYRLALKEVPARQRTRVALRLLWPPADVARASDALANGRRDGLGAVRARLSRMGRGAMGLLHGLRRRRRGGRGGDGALS